MFLKLFHRVYRLFASRGIEHNEKHRGRCKHMNDQLFKKKFPSSKNLKIVISKVYREKYNSNFEFHYFCIFTVEEKSLFQIISSKFFI